MGTEVRAAAPDEMDRLYQITRYAFADNSGEWPATLHPDWTTCAFVDGTMAAVHGAYPFRVRLNGASVMAAGVTAVATDPRYRRRGLLREIMAHAMPEQRERGQALAILWASQASIYQRFGYGAATRQARYRFDPRFVELRDDGAGSGEVEVLEPERALDIVKPLYVEYATPRNLYIHRPGEMWEIGVLRPPRGLRTHVAVARDDRASPRGYMVYQTQAVEPDVPGTHHRMVIREMVGLDAQATWSLWRFVLRHDLVRDVELAVPEDDPLFNLVLEPRALDKRIRDGVWMRVIDAEAALRQRPYGAAGSLALEIPADDLCPWNAGLLRIDTDGEKTEVTGSGGVADLTVPISSLARLVAGHDSATDLARAGMIDVLRPEKLAHADRLFATAYRPYCPDGF